MTQLQYFAAVCMNLQLESTSTTVIKQVLTFCGPNKETHARLSPAPRGVLQFDRTMVRWAQGASSNVPALMCRQEQGAPFVIARVQ